MSHPPLPSAHINSLANIIDLPIHPQSNWGIVDVHDTVQCVAALGKFGKIDASKVAIRGGSAGGYTTLAALTDSKVFTAGVSLYGVADVKLLASDTHKVSCLWGL